MKHTILGAGGSIGNALAFKLLENKEDVRLVSRSKLSIFGTEWVRADLSSYTETLESLKGTDIAYLCVGLPYDFTVWKELWPKIMKNTIDACKEVDAKLIFFDNVYMYGNVSGKMIESTPYNPCSKKGELRAKIDTMLQNEIDHKNIDAIIARAADLYGPYITNASVPYLMVLSPLLNSKRAQWLINSKLSHSYTYTLDCANALYLLSNDNEAFNQVWHLPTFSPPINGKTMIEFAAKEIGVTPKFSVLPKVAVKVAGLFSKTIKETVEMLYQNEFPYIFDSSKFNNHYNYTPKSYNDGIKETIEFLKNK